MIIPHRFSHGFTLIELVIFILVITLLTTGIFVGFNRMLTDITYAEDNNRATQLAKERMEILLGARDSQGFTLFVNDPCAGGPPPTLCAAPAGYNIASTIVPAVNPNFKTVTVTVSGRGAATLITQVANYG